ALVVDATADVLGDGVRVEQRLRRVGPDAAALRRDVLRDGAEAQEAAGLVEQTSAANGRHVGDERAALDLARRAERDAAAFGRLVARELDVLHLEAVASRRGEEAATRAA